MKMIVAAVDFSDATPRIVEEAAKLAQAIDAHVVLLHVLRMLQPLPRYSTEMVNLAQTRAALEVAAEEQLARIKMDLRTRGITAHTLRLAGDASTDIVEQAEKLGVDYIVMGSHGHSAFHDLVLGSTTTAVLKRSKHAVVVVPAPKKARKGPRAALADVATCRAGG